MSKKRKELVRYTEWLRSRILAQGDDDPLGESEDMVEEYLDSIDVLDPPGDDPYWIVERDSTGAIRLAQGRGMHIGARHTTRADIQNWYDMATEKKWRKTYGAALDLLDREEGRE